MMFLSIFAAPSLQVRFLAPLGAVLVLLLGLVSAGALAQSLDDPLGSLETLGLLETLADLEKEELTPPESFVVRALLEPQQSAKLSSEMDGKITRLHKKDGERFQKGDRLVTFDCASRKIEQKRLEARLNSTRLIYENALQLQSLNSIGELDVRLAEAESFIAQAELDASKLGVQRCAVSAPFNGRVIEVARKQHEWISIGEPLMEIFNDNDYVLKMLVPSSWLVWLKPGTEFVVDIDETGKRYDAKITKVGARIDPVSRSITVRGKIANSDNNFIHSMSGNAVFAPQSEE